MQLVQLYGADVYRVTQKSKPLSNEKNRNKSY